MTEIDDRSLTLAIRGEYLGIPALRVTARQAQSWWGMEPARCERLLAALVADRFLQRTANDGYVRVDRR